MRMGRIVDLLTPISIDFAFLLGEIPIFFRNDSLMLSLVHGKLRLFNHVHLIPGTNLLLCPASAIGNFPHIYRIVNDTFHKAGGKTGNGAVLPQLLHKALPVQIFRHTADTIVGVNIAVKDGADHVHFILSNQQFAFFKTVSIRGKAAVPFSFTGFLLPSGHRLCPNIFTLYLCHRRKDRNHQLAGIFGTVNAVFHTNQIDTEILHQLQGIQNVSGIPAKPGQLEHQHIFHTVFAVLNVLQHPLKFVPALNILAGKAFIRIFTSHYHIFVFSVFPQFVSLSIQTVSVHLHGSRYPCVEIAFCFSFFHAGRPFLPSLNIHP